MAGLGLDPWEEFVLVQSLGEAENGKWAAFEVAVVAPRQNGKNEILLGRQLVGLFLLGERLQISSAHQFDTSLEAFRRLLAVIEDTPDFDRRVQRVSRSHGEEGIELKGGQRIRFRTRTKGGGRGFSSDALYLDEAMDLPESAHGALLPTLSARPNPQVWYTASAVDQWVHEHGVVLSRIRERGLDGGDPALAYFEWSVDAENPDRVDDVNDEEAWARANPGLGIRISSEHIGREQRSMDPRTFAVERLCVGDWPRTDGLEEQVLEPVKWRGCADADSKTEDPVALAFDVAPDRSTSSIGAAGRRGDEKLHIEVVDRRRGTGWVVDRLVELIERHKPQVVLCDGSGPAASLLAQLQQREVDVVIVTAKEHAQACGLLFDAIEEDELRHLDTPELNAAVKGAKKRPLGDAWAWSRKSSTIDISPLVACTLAAFGVAGEAAELVYGRDFKLELL